MLETYLVRVYRRAEQAGKSEVAGFVEFIADGSKKSFQTTDELCELLSKNNSKENESA